MIHKNDSALAQNILDHSLELKSGEHVMLQLNGLNGIDLMRALVKQVRQRGAFPYLRINDAFIQRELMETGNEDFWRHQADAELPVMEKMDAFVGVRASQNIYENSGVCSEANKAHADHYLKPVHFQERVNNTRWVVLRYPSPAFAMNAKMSTDRFENFYYKACLLDYNRLEEAMKPLHERLKNTSMVRLKGEGTDIAFSVEGQTWIPCFAKRNVPDGELFSSPILDSVNGHITYTASVYQGKPFEYVRLEVEDGVVQNFDSSNNEALAEILDTDEGARRFGEFSFGLNPVIDQPMYDILFDEKIYGSNHLTLGHDYEVAPNGNTSGIHWDLVCIGADVYLDDEKIREGRTFITDDLKGLNPDSLLGD